MLAETGLPIERVFVRLLDQGTEVFRPTDAVQRASGHYLLLAPEGYDAEHENWEFKPGAVVAVEPRELSCGLVLVAVSAAP